MSRRSSSLKLAAARDPLHSWPGRCRASVRLGYDRKCGVDFPMRNLHPLEDLPHTFATTLPCKEHAGVEDYSHIETLRGLRLLMISSRSAANSGSRVGGS